ncbi:hypothetical protein FRC14_006542 [Serendipita sp. 396]|nr:hypothetical protein FRC14_006542 [Serendipita sp. 396]KAG8819645.1 hypothetical protein FRC19_009631 [Serendipita sp. 401]
MASLQGKVAIVTGSSRGIGAAIAIALARQGANIVVNHVSPKSKARAEEVAKAVEELGPKALVVQADLSQLPDLESLVKQAVAAFGKVDILVNNGGVTQFAHIGEITPLSYQQVFDVNVRATIFLSQAVVPHMGKGGRIINVSSTAARQGIPTSAVYAASKGAVESLTRVMGIELRDKEIRVNAVAPGPVMTDMYHSVSEEERAKKRAGAYVPVAEPSDIADAVAFLASPASRWVTGFTLSVNNGVVLL